MSDSIQRRPHADAAALKAGRKIQVHDASKDGLAYQRGLLRGGRPLQRSAVVAAYLGSIPATAAVSDLEPNASSTAGKWPATVKKPDAGLKRLLWGVEEVARHREEA